MHAYRYMIDAFGLGIFDADTWGRLAGCVDGVEKTYRVDHRVTIPSQNEHRSQHRLRYYRSELVPGLIILRVVPSRLYQV